MINDENKGEEENMITQRNRYNDTERYFLYDNRSKMRGQRDEKQKFKDIRCIKINVYIQQWSTGNQFRDHDCIFNCDSIQRFRFLQSPICDRNTSDGNQKRCADNK